MFLTECFESVSGKEETGIGCLLNQLFFLTDTNILKFLMSDKLLHIILRTFKVHFAQEGLGYHLLAVYIWYRSVKSCTKLKR